MKKTLPSLAALMAVLAPASLHAQQDAPAIDPNSILSSLEKLDTVNQSASQHVFNAAYNEIRDAAASGSRATDLYEKAFRATNFVGLPQGVAAFQEWKKKNGEKNRAAPFQQAIQLHLEYLLLTLRFAKGATDKELAQELIAYTDKVFAAKPEVLSQEMARRGVGDGIFVRWYGLGHLARSVKNWENVPAAADGIWEKTLLPLLREEKNRPLIIGYWDERLRREAQAAIDRRLEFDADNFDNITRPTLLWNRAQDLALLGSRNMAINEMLGLIKEYPTHPNNPGWISSLKALLAPPETAKE